MDDRGNIWTEEQLKELARIDKKKLDELGKLIEITPEDKDVFDMSSEDKRKWYKKMLQQRREFPIPK